MKKYQIYLFHRNPSGWEKTDKNIIASSSLKAEYKYAELYNDGMVWNVMAVETKNANAVDCLIGGIYK